MGRLLVVGGAVGAAVLFRSKVFVPPPSVKSPGVEQLSAATCAAALFAAESAHADAIGDAAAKLSAAAYPFIKDIDWTSNLFAKPIPGQDAQAVMKAVDKMIVMGSAMDGAALKEAAAAHVKAIEGMDSKGVLTQADFAAINAGLGKAIASVPTSKVMDVYNAVGKVVGSSPVPNYLFSQVNPNDATAAYNALLEFKDVVKAASR